MCKQTPEQLPQNADVNTVANDAMEIQNTASSVMSLNKTILNSLQYLCHLSKWNEIKQNCKSRVDSKNIKLTFLQKGETKWL